MPRPAPLTALAALLAASAAPAFEVCMEGGPWLSYYLSELDKGHFERVLALTTPLPGKDRAAMQAMLRAARDKGELDAGAMARLTIEGACVSDTPEIARSAKALGLAPESIVGPPDWFHFVDADLAGL